ncbi:MAG: nucleoside recognition protein [Blautia sp.]|nr:nucleoside recognition protein [Lachnoclostridium sp.]MCM1212511.1 nucleoside recognition protein [Blautia sp.]
MLNYIWAFMILVGVIFGAFTGNIEEVSNAALDSAGEAVTLCITMIGIMSLWVGLMEIAKKSGLIAAMTKGISPFITFLFPRIPKNHPAREYISTNLIANILGLGWACTPAGLKAMEELAKLEAERGNPEYLADRKAFDEKRLADGDAGKREGIFGKKERTASKEMCDFLILNISSLQLIPVNMIVYRQQYGSVNPAAVIAPAIVATFISTGVAVVFCKVKGGKWLR